MSSQIKICPLRMLISESQANIQENGFHSNGPSNAVCIAGRCAWWNADFGQCALTALSVVATRPVVEKERRWWDDED
ncbi:MAG: hypothetical protein DRN81_06075 [Thermoproteota archaeon]|nr:MAG: hypothetical protein DRN81_06075 [Candidatus Korarchaeota archaeon]